VTESPSILLDGGAIARAVARLAHQILERDRTVDQLVLVGVRSRGVQLAHRIAQKLEEVAGRVVPVGAIDIAPYRDDVENRTRSVGTETDVAFSIDNAVVVLVDDVLSTGRTARRRPRRARGLGRPEGHPGRGVGRSRQPRGPDPRDFVGQKRAGDDAAACVRVRELTVATKSCSMRALR
jgi:pyrimidine operon attenuation protein/uracil phosphoribosyltransferase